MNPRYGWARQSAAFVLLLVVWEAAGRAGQLNPWLHHMLHETNVYSASSGPVESRVATSDTRPSGGVVPSSSRFPWRDIAIGAAGTLAVALLAAGALFAVRRTRGRFAPVS